MKKFLALSLILLAPRVWSQETSGESFDELNSKYKVSLNSEASRLTFGAYGQFSSFTRQGINLVGWTLEVPATYALTDSLAAQISISQSIDLSKSLTVLFTGFHFGGAYAFSGSFVRKKSDILVNGSNVVSVSNTEGTLLAVEGGLDQILFNGSGRVVPATGFSVSLRSDFDIFGFRSSAMARYGALVITDEPVAMLTAGLGLLIRY